MNVSSSPVKMYNGMKLGYVTPLQNVLVAENDKKSAAVNTSPVLQVNLETSDLPPSEKSKLLDFTYRIC